ncbi:hypothetical protein MTP03_23540 [Tsukamurella sp. PLM1]|nr:hypothetical protein MTP03_23540 [Tsukamurella sp. PLM1]
MAQGDANKVWVVPSDFNAALQGFMRNLGTQGSDGVFRFEPSEEGQAAAPDIDTDGWFTNPEPVAPVVVTEDEVPDAPTRRAARPDADAPQNTPPQNPPAGAAPAADATAQLPMAKPAPSPYQVQQPGFAPQHEA